MNTIAIIQARMGSTRLPGKVMMRLCGKTVLAHVISRVKRCSLVDKVVIATTTMVRDDVIEKEARRCGAEVYRGSEDNVLERYFEAAKEHSADVVVRITSDCPLYDPELLCRMLESYARSREAGDSIDYFANNLSRTFPRGLDTEVFTLEALHSAYRKSVRHYEKEHVTPFIRENPGVFRLAEYTSETNLSHLRWTLDTEEDLRMIATVFDSLYPRNSCFSTSDVLQLLETKPEIAAINAHIEQLDYKLSG